MSNFSVFYKYKLKFCVGIMVTALILNGCGMLKGEKKPTPKEEPPVKIGVAMATMEGDGYAALKKAMEKMKKAEKVELIWMDAKNDEKTQTSQIDKLVKEKVKVIILHMVNPIAGRELVGKLQEKNIRVLAIEKLPENVALDGYVTPDYLRAGEVQGQFVAKQAPKGTVLLFSGTRDVKADRLLLQGFRQGLGTGSPLVVQQVKTSDTLDPKVIEEEVVKALEKSPQVAAVVTQSGAHTMGLIKYLQMLEKKDQEKKNQDMGNQDKVTQDKGKMNKATQDKLKSLVTVGLGADKTASVALAGEKHDAEVDTRPDLIAYYALKGAKQLAEGKHLEYDQRVKNDESDVPTKVIPVRLIKLDNVYLLKERWGDLKKEAKKLEEKAKKKAAEEEGKPKVKITDDQDAQEESEGSQVGQDSQGSGGSEGSEGSQAGQGGQGGQSSESGQQKGSQQKKTKLMIKTKEGKIIEIEVEGDIAEIKSQAGGSGQGQEGEGGGQESGQ